jgi:MoaA/NifB/PqqE/SkfB family radical SAM enzyme
LLFDNLGIAITNKCNGRCDICCFACDPEQETTLDKDLVFDIIRQAVALHGMKWIGFSGGEAMLYRDALMQSIEFAVKSGIDATLTSNGYWAQDYSECVKILEYLQNIGLHSLTISVDEYHLRYVDIGCVKNILKANRYVGLKLSIAIGDSREGLSAADIIRELHTGLYAMGILMYPFMPIGRGMGITPDKLYLEPYNASWRCCYNKHGSILYDGTVYPCCSQAIYNNRISIANIREKTLGEIISAYEDEGIFSTLNRKGFDFFMKIAREEMGLSLPSAYVSPCHLCNILFSNDAFVSYIQPHIQKEYLEHIKTTLGL